MYVWAMVIPGTGTTDWPFDAAAIEKIITYQ